ncbi:ribbon-helix-helix domain-containing protein [Agrobacterium sp. CG674]
MEIEENGNARRAATYRKKRIAAGESQVTVWLNADLQDKLDSLVSAGKFKNRSDLIAHAVAQFEEH